MNSTNRKLLPAIALLAMAALATPAVAAEVDCTMPSGQEQVRACQAAKSGVDSLRQFIQRTRGIYILYIQEFGNAVPIKVASADEEKATGATVASADDKQVRSN
jgi:hypothetical protein